MTIRDGDPPGTHVTIRRGGVADAAGYRDCVASVARERKYLVTVQGFSLEETTAFLHRIDIGNWPCVVTVSEERIVGWCDIIPRASPGFAHVGTLGIGVLPEWRGRGIGRRMICECLEMGRAAGLERVEIMVYSDNARAIQLYESVGFAHEGRKIKARKLDGCYQDEVLMGFRFEQVTDVAR